MEVGMKKIHKENKCILENGLTNENNDSNINTMKCMPINTKKRIMTQMYS